jgi:predicted transcriptional regulator
MPEILQATARVAAAYLGNHEVNPTAIPDLIHCIMGALTTLDAPEALVPERQRPAVPIKRSVFPDYLVCLEDGMKLKMLKRHLRAAFDMSPEEYRRKWNLPPSYPMVAPAYSAIRSEVAKEMGLGTGSHRRKGKVAAKKKATRLG